MMKKSLLFLMALLLLVAVGQLQARPEKTQPGVIYHSEEIDDQEPVPDLVGDRNYEEVYRNYTRFEATYDEQGRVKTMKEFKRGELKWEETYFYDEKGNFKSKSLKGEK